MSAQLIAKTPVGSQLLQQLANNKLFSHSWPVTLAWAAAFLVVESTPWTHPTIVAVLTGALVQVFIALMRNWFTERRELLNTMREMLQEQRSYVHSMLQDEQADRHNLANRAAAAELKVQLMRIGVPFEELPKSHPLYPKAEQPALADAIDQKTS